MKFRDYLNEKRFTMEDVREFLKDNDITNMDLELSGKIIKLSGWISKSGSAFDDFYDMMREQYGRKFNFIEWDKDIAKFEIKL